MLSYKLSYTKLLVLVALIIIFFATVVTSLVYIIGDVDHIPNGKKSPNVKPGILTPQFTPDSVTFASKEGVRIMLNQDTEKNNSVKQSPIELVDKTKSVDKLKIDRSLPTASAATQFIIPSGRCEEVKSVKFNYLVRNTNVIEDINEQSYWKLSNNTNQTVSVIIKQKDIDLFVAFLPPHAIFQTRLPGGNLSFQFRSSRDTCINWATGYSFSSEIPNLDEAGNPITSYKNAIFETTTLNSGTQLKARTKFIGYAEN